MAVMYLEESSSEALSFGVNLLPTNYIGKAFAMWYLGYKNGGAPTINDYYKDDIVYCTESNPNCLVTFDGLEADSTYHILCRIYYNSTLQETLTGYAETESEDVTTVIPLWSWLKSNGTATDKQTKNAKKAIDYNGYTTDFHYKVWNDMVTKARDIRKIAGRTWNGYYASYNNTLMSTSDKEMTAKRFNSVLYNMSHIYDISILDYVDEGDKILGSYFEDLADIICGAIAYYS